MWKSGFLIYSVRRDGDSLGDNMYRMVIADDEEIVRNGIREAIDWQSLGITVTGCVGDGEALCREAIATRADIAMVDIRMPILDGLAAIERIRKELPGCECIIFTAYEDFSYARKALELGVMAYITKPVLKEEVIEKAQLAVRRLKKREQAARQDVPDEAAPISRIKRYVMSHLSTVSLLSAADHMQMNPAYLSRYFKEKTGENFVDYCKTVKLEKACQLLRETSMKIYEIANELGYTNAQHFSTVFRENKGITPLEYRQSRGKEQKR